MEVFLLVQVGTYSYSAPWEWVGNEWNLFFVSGSAGWKRLSVVEVAVQVQKVGFV
jgi:hypothetical protein